MQFRKPTFWEVPDILDPSVPLSICNDPSFDFVCCLRAQSVPLVFIFGIESEGRFLKGCTVANKQLGNKLRLFETSKEAGIFQKLSEVMPGR